jgi:hypothetical protein
VPIPPICLWKQAHSRLWCGAVPCCVQALTCHNSGLLATSPPLRLSPPHPGTWAPGHHTTWTHTAYGYNQKKWRRQNLTYIILICLFNDDVSCEFSFYSIELYDLQARSKDDSTGSLTANFKYFHSIFQPRQRTTITIHDTTDGVQPKIWARNIPNKAGERLIPPWWQASVSTGTRQVCDVTHAQKSMHAQSEELTVASLVTK